MSALRPPAAFLDRDGTIIVEREYLADPDGVELLPGSVTALHTLRRLGYALVVVTNQSGIGRGYYTEKEFFSVQQRLNEMLAVENIHFDAIYFCPHHPDFTGKCECRKPGPGMYQRAQQELDIDLGRSIFVGDRLTDAQPAVHFGGQGFVVRSGHGLVDWTALPDGVSAADDLHAVAEIIERQAALKSAK